MSKRARKPKAAHPDKKIGRLREQIDRVDARVLELLAKRGGLVEQVGEIKRESDATFHAPARERELLARVIKDNPGPYPDESIESIFREIMSASLALESPLTVAFGADAGTHARKAIRRRFGRSARARKELSSVEALAAVEGGWADYAVIDLEDSVAGFHGRSVDALCDAGASVSGEIVSASGGQKTRFLIAGGDPPAATGNDRTSVVFVVRNEPGGLLRVLGEFSERGVNMTCIESRPLPGQSWQYRFFVDLDGHREQPDQAAALDALEQSGFVFKVLGSYPKDTN